MKLMELKKGKYVADYRYDEGLRVRQDFVSPCLQAKSGGGLPHDILLIIVNEDKRSDQEGVCRSD